MLVMNPGFYMPFVFLLQTYIKNLNFYASLIKIKTTPLIFAFKLGKYNVGREEEILTIPIYMGFLIKDKLTEIIAPVAFACFSHVTDVTFLRLKVQKT